MDQKIDAVMTVATKGVPLANAVANVLNVPFVIVRRDLKLPKVQLSALTMYQVQVVTALRKCSFQNAVSKLAAVS